MKPTARRRAAQVTSLSCTAEPGSAGSAGSAVCWSMAGQRQGLGQGAPGSSGSEFPASSPEIKMEAHRGPYVEDTVGDINRI